MTEEKTQQQKLKDLLDVQHDQTHNNYYIGLYNGLLCAYATLEFCTHDYYITHLKSTTEEIKMNEEKKDDNAIEDFLKGPQAEFEQPFEGMFNQLHLTINALNNKIKSMQVDIDKLKAPKVSVDESDSDSDELDNKPEHCCQIS